MEGPARMACEPDLDVLVLVSGVVVEDGMDRDAGGYRARDAVAESRELLGAMPTGVPAMTVPSSTVRAANSVVVPLRLESCVMVAPRPFFSDRPGCVRSSA